MPDNIFNTPISCTVVFPRLGTGTGPYAVVVLGTGHAGTQVIQSTALASFSTNPLIPDNATELLALANQVGADFYAWRLASLEVRYESVRYESADPWIADGMHDVEFIHGPGMLMTSVHRSEWEPDTGVLAQSGTFGSTPVITPLPEWSPTVTGVLTTTTQMGRGDKTTQDGSWSVLDSATQNEVTIHSRLSTPTLEMTHGAFTSSIQMGADSSTFLLTNINGPSSTINTQLTPSERTFYLFTDDVNNLGNPVLPAYSISNGADQLDGIWAIDPIGNEFSGGIVTQTGGLSTGKGALAVIWCSNTTSGAVNTLQASNNVLSVTRNSAGNYTVTFSITFNDANAFTWAGSAVGTTLSEVSRTASSVRVVTATAADATNWGIAVFGSVALNSGGGPGGTNNSLLFVNPNLTLRAINAPNLLITGIGFDPTATNDLLMFSTLGAVGLTAPSPAPSYNALQINFPPTGGTTAPLTTGILMLILTNTTLGLHTPSTPVATIVPAPTLTTTTTSIGQTSQIITLTGTGFDPNPLGNIVTFTTLGPPTGIIQSVSPDGTTMTVLMSTPSATGTLSAFVNSYGGNSNTTGIAVVGTGTHPIVSYNAQVIPANSATLIFYGFYFSATPASNTVTLSQAGGTPTVTAVTSATTTSLHMTIAGLVAGPLYAVVTVGGLTSGPPVQVAMVGAGPVLTAGTRKLADNATSLFVICTGLSPTLASNLIALSPTGTAVAGYVSAGTNDLGFSVTGLSLGALTATVTVNGQSSAAVQVATVVHVSVTLNKANLSATATSITIAGANFEPQPLPGNNFPWTGAISLMSGTTLISAQITGTTIDGSSLVATFPPGTILPLGPLTAVVFAWRGSSGAAVQVATVVSSTPLWYDTFTEASTTTLDLHTPNVGTGGYTLISGAGTQGTITGGTPGWYSSGAGVSTANYLFDPGTNLSSMSLTFVWQADMGAWTFEWNGRGSVSIDFPAPGTIIAGQVGFTGNSTGISLTIGNTYTVSVTDDGTNVAFYLEGVLMFTVNDTTIPSSTTCQMFIESTSGPDPAALITSLTIL